MKDDSDRLVFWFLSALTVAWITYVVGREVLEVRALWNLGSQNQEKR